MRMLALLAMLPLGCPDPTKLDTGSAAISDADEDGWPTAQDCNDRDASIHPDAVEICDGVDNDCDEAVDEEVEVTVWADADGDGYGDPAAASLACAPGEGQADNDQDCDDGDPRAHPGADEVCNARDDDCDDTVDEDPTDGSIFHLDRDGDGYGDPETTAVACLPGGGLVIDATDCHDDEPSAYPGSEAWEHPEDGVDQDCDGFDGSRDLDGDGLCDLFFPSYRDEETWVQQSPVYLGDEQGFDPDRATWLQTRGALAALAEDLDGDGRPELVVPAYYDDTVPSYSLEATIYQGRAGGPDPSWATTLPTEGALDVTAADLDQDGFSDLIFAGYYAAGSYETGSRIYWSQGGAWDAGVATDLATTGAYHVEAGDLDGDGWLDLAFTSRQSPDGYHTHASVFMNRGGSFDDPIELPITGSTHLVIADFDADGWGDVALSAFRDDDNVFELQSRVYTGSATGPDPERFVALATAGAFALAAADLNADGYDDLAVANYRSDTSVLTDSAVFHGSAEGLIEEARVALPTAGARDVAVADLDGDGWLDLTFASYYGEAAYDTESPIYWGAATGFSTDAVTTLPTTGAFRVRAGDVDHDGWKDLVFASYYSGSSYSSESSVYYGSPGGFSTEHREALPVVGAWAWPLLVGAD
jgi:hypothetical protein